MITCRTEHVLFYYIVLGDTSSIQRMDFAE